MVQFVYNDKDYLAVLEQFAKVVGGKVENNRLLFPEGFASGTNEILILPNGLQVALIDYTIHQDFLIKREKSKEEFYTLRFDEVTIKDKLTVEIDGETISDNQHIRASVLLSSSLFDFTYFGTKGGSIRGVNVLITKEWLATYLGIKSKDEVLRQYISLKTANFNLEPLDSSYRELMNEILAESPPVRSAMNIIMVQNRVMLLAERFFTRLYEKMKDFKANKPIDNDEIQRIMDAEALLVSDFAVPAPTIAELAKHAAMSETKFKNEFKKIYNAGPYEYFQKNRMQRGRYLLLTRKYSVKEVGTMLGYNNLSNFSIAYRKEYGVLPSNM